MTREDMDEVLKLVEAQTVRARSIGAYSTEAESIMIMWEIILKITRHLHDKEPRKKS